MQPIRFLKKQPKPHLQGKFCSTPFTDLAVDEKGNYTLCRCQHYMSFVVGQSDLSTAWNSETANLVRNSVISGTFDYCSWSCPALGELTEVPDKIPSYTSPKYISISNDYSCNLKCPSCREKTIIEKDPQILARQNQIIDQILKINDTVIVDPCNNGEPLVSPSTMHFLRKLSEGQIKNIKINLSTNGTLIYHYKDLLESLFDRIIGFSISIDAASKSTYEPIRGEYWDDLMQGIKWLQENKNFSMTARFVVQQKNWQEMPQFVQMCCDLGFDSIHFQKIRDWGHWSDTWWKENMLTKSQFQDAKLIASELYKKYGNLLVFDREFFT